MRRLLSIVMLGLVVLSCAACSIKKETVTDPETIDSQTFELQAASDGARDVDLGTLDLYFADEVDDLPYVSVADWADLMVRVNKPTAPKFAISSSRKHDRLTLKRETGVRVTINSNDDTIVAPNYEGFLRSTATDTFDDVRVAECLQKAGSALSIPGKNTVFNLGTYSINIVRDQNTFLIPLQTANDLLPVGDDLHVYFSGLSLYAGSDEDLASIALTEAVASPSNKLAKYTYNELCLMLDSFYGPRSQHKLVSFASMLKQNKISPLLASGKRQKVEKGLAQTIAYVLNDYESKPGPDMTTSIESDAQGQLQKRVAELQDARSARYGQGIPAYEEVGDTAFVVIDDLSLPSTSPYEVSADALKDSTDALSTIAYAHKRITRADSPVRNVVLDLSCCTTGQKGAAVWATAWMLGTSNLATSDTLTSRLETMYYRADINLDHEFNDDDTLTGKRLYCLVSPATVSYGNLVAQALKASGSVRLVGSATGGGAFEPRTGLTVLGSSFTYSGNSMLCYVDNGLINDVTDDMDAQLQLPSSVDFCDRDAIIGLL